MVMSNGVSLRLRMEGRPQEELMGIGVQAKPPRLLKKRSKSGTLVSDVLVRKLARAQTVALRDSRAR